MKVKNLNNYKTILSNDRHVLHIRKGQRQSQSSRKEVPRKVGLNKNRGITFSEKSVLYKQTLNHFWLLWLNTVDEYIDMII